VKGTHNSDAKRAGRCPDSPEYGKIIDAALEQIYNPNSLGDWRSLRHKYDCQIHSQADAVKYAERALAQAKDPYTRLDHPEVIQITTEHKEGTEYGFGGRFRFPPVTKQGDNKLQGDILVEAVFPNSPLERSGIQFGDRITKIDGRSVNTMTVQDADEVFHFGPNQKTFTIVKGGMERTVSVSSAEVKVPAVRVQEMENGITYLRVGNFEANTLPDQMEQVLMSHSSSKAFIIDLRNNPGGKIGNALTTAQFFVDHGKLASTTSRIPSRPDHPEYHSHTWYLTPGRAFEADDRFDRSYYARRPYLAGGRPIVVLVDGSTASASETFAAALHDLAHATLIGERTFGKSVVQNDIPDMPGGTSLHITTGRGQTAGGKYLGDGARDRHGLEPEIKVRTPVEALRTSSDDAGVQAAVDYLTYRSGQ